MGCPRCALSLHQGGDCINSIATCADGSKACPAFEPNAACAAEHKCIPSYHNCETCKVKRPPRD